MFKAFQTFCILVASVLSCKARNCCFPNQFEAKFKHVLIMAGKTGNLVQTESAMSFDTIGKRIYYKADIYVDNRTESTVQLQLYEKGVQYTVLNNKKCFKASLKQWTNQNCIPGYAVKLPPSTLGMKPSLKVQDYSWKVAGTITTMTVTSNTCAPVFSEYHWSFPGNKMMGVYKFENVTPGIKNPCVFEVPDICKHVQVSEEIATRRPMFPF